MWLILWIFLTILAIILIVGFLSTIFVIVDLGLFDGELSELIQDRAKEWLHKKLDKE
jgi:hypothetical protein